jgi:preprotein translocase subunit Sss1
MVAPARMMAGSAIAEISRVWIAEIPTERTANQIQEIVDNCLDAYKVALTTESFTPAQMDDRGQYCAALIVRLQELTGYTGDTIRDFLFSLDSAYHQGSIDIAQYDPARAKSTTTIVRELEPTLWDRFTTGVVKPYGDFIQGALTKALVIGAIGGVGYLLIRYGFSSKQAAQQA